MQKELDNFPEVAGQKLRIRRGTALHASGFA
jgi:hypothetical protein